MKAAEINIKNHIKRTPAQIIRLVVVLFVLGLANQIVFSYILTEVLALMPEVGASYEQTISAITKPTLDMLILVCIVAPVLEEAFFRGLVLGVLKRFAPFIVANVTQALAFGIYHGNLVQGVYAFLIGMYIGYIAYVTGTFLYTIVLHMSINIMGMFLPYMIPEDAAEYIKVLAAIIALIITVLIVRGIKNDRLADSQ